MNYKERRMNERLKKKARINEEEPTRAWHSISYHKYFEGYEESVVKDEMGRSKIVRNYVGSRFERNVSNKVNIFLKVLYWAILAISIVLFFFAATRDVTINTKWYMAVPQFITIIMFIWNLKGIFNATISPRSMTIGDFKSSSKSLKISTWVSFVSLILDFLITIFYFIFEKQNASLYIISCVLYILSSLFILLMNRIEYKIKYTEHKYEGPHDPEASEIQS